MPAPLPDFLDVPSQPVIRVAIEPAKNAVHSLLLLCKDETHSGLANWVTETRLGMSEEERQANQLVVFGLHYAVQPTEDWSSFPVYIDYLSRMNATALRDKMMDSYDRLPILAHAEDEGVIDRRTALESTENYLAYLYQRFPAGNIDEELELRAYQYVIDPPSMRQMIVDHLWRMWRKYLKPEWERVRPMLLETMRVYQQVDFSQMTFQEAYRVVTGRDFVDEKWQRSLGEAQRLVFVPHPHTGPYLMKYFGEENTLYVFFSPRPPSGVSYEIPDLNRTEIVVRLGALADDTRLRILRFIAEHGEQRSQEIMEALDLSQSAASRHLTQLSATGYLKERRCEGAKCYALDPERIHDTLRAIANFLLVRERSEI